MKFLLTTALAVLLGATATAQHFNFGLKGGLNLYTMTDVNDIEFENAVGYHVGLVAHIHFTDKFAMQPELVYSTQGADFKIRSYDGEYNLDYLNVPIMFQYMFDNGFRLQGGPQIGFLVEAKAKLGSNKEDIKSDCSSLDFGMGAGMSYVHPRFGFGVDARYNIGLNNITDDSSVELANRGFQLGVFYLFNHKS